jgi:transketolase
MTEPLDGRSASTDFAERAHVIRRLVLQMCRGRGQGYAGQGLALADLMSCLYYGVLRRDSDETLRDAVVLSTGHSAIAIFAALGSLGRYPLEQLITYGMDGSPVEESPLEGTPGFEITGGSLGQGLSQAVGIALGERMRGTGNRVYCIVSDGELQEGQTWEAAMFAAHHQLDDLVVLVDNNRTQADGETATVMGVEPIPDKFAAFGFATCRVDAHNYEDMLDAFAFARASRGRPTAVICQTVLGKGAPSVEAYRNVHYIRAKDAFWERAIAELDHTAATETDTIRGDADATHAGSA